MNHKPKIIILSCHGGGGHMSVAAALTNYLSTLYETKTLDLIGTSLAPQDPFYRLTGKYTGQDIYNFLLQHNAKRTTNFLYRLGTWMIRLRRKQLHKAIAAIIRNEAPALIISVIPMVNDIISAVCTELDIPCLIIPTDFDVSSFIGTMPQIIGKKTIICLPLSAPEVCAQVPAHIPKSMLRTTGFIIRPAFFEHYNTQALKKECGIPEHKPVILLIMGAAGSSATLIYLYELRTITTPMHLIICVGRATYLIEKIKSITLPSHISYTVITHEHTIAEYMALADLCITKPGSVTFAETLYMNVPMLLDRTSPPLLWERLNLTLVKKYNLGNVICTRAHIRHLVSYYVTNSALLDGCKKNIEQLEKQNCAQHIHDIVRELVRL